MPRKLNRVVTRIHDDFAMIDMTAMPRGCSVDAELFDNLEDAIAFVAERGGGVVYTELVDSTLAQIIMVPPSVTLAPPRLDATPAKDGFSIIDPQLP